MSDDAWEQIAGAFPPPAAVGRKRKDPRDTVDGILYVLRRGCPWRDLPEDFGPGQSVSHRFNKWSGDRSLDEVLHRLVAAHVGVGAIDEDLGCVDGTNVRAARCAARGGKKGFRASQLSMR